MFNPSHGLFGFETSAYRMQLPVDTNVANWDEYVPGRFVRFDGTNGVWVLADSANYPVVAQIFTGKEDPGSEMVDGVAGVFGYYTGETDQVDLSAGTPVAEDPLTIGANGQFKKAVTGEKVIAMALKYVDKVLTFIRVVPYTMP